MNLNLGKCQDSMHSLCGVCVPCRYECGISKPSASIPDADKEGVISSLCLHFVVLATKAELDDMVNGLKSLGILALIRENPVLARQLFVKGSPKHLTADTLYDIFTADLSPPMSNWRDKEEAQLMNWANFLEFVEGMLGLLLLESHSTTLLCRF